MEIPTLVLVLIVLVPVMYYWDLSRSRDQVCKEVDDICEKYDIIFPAGKWVVSIMGVIALLVIIWTMYTTFSPTGRMVKEGLDMIEDDLATSLFGTRRRRH